MSDEIFIYLCTSFVPSSDFVQSFSFKLITKWQSMVPLLTALQNIMQNPCVLL